MMKLVLCRSLHCFFLVCMCRMVLQKALDAAGPIVHDEAGALTQLALFLLGLYMLNGVAEGAACCGGCSSSQALFRWLPCPSSGVLSSALGQGGRMFN